jgi:hypothetical protein
MKGFRKPTKSEIIKNQKEIINEMVKIINTQKGIIEAYSSNKDKN